MGDSIVNIKPQCWGNYGFRLCMIDCTVRELCKLCTDIKNEIAANGLTPNEPVKPEDNKPQCYGLEHGKYYQCPYCTHYDDCRVDTQVHKTMQGYDKKRKPLI